MRKRMRDRFRTASGTLDTRATLANIAVVAYRVVADQVGIKTGLSSKVLVCVITETGSFVHMPPNGWKTGGSVGFRILHAQSGNLLFIGFRYVPFDPRLAVHSEKAFCTGVGCHPRREYTLTGWREDTPGLLARGRQLSRGGARGGRSYVLPVDQ